MSDRKQRKHSSLKTLWIPRTKFICIVVAICVLTIWSGFPASVVRACLPNSWIQKDFAESPYMFVYLFNWTNMYDPANTHVKPNFVQLGPYVFRADVRWANNDTLPFCIRTWFFERQMSIGALDDLISVFYPPDSIVANRIRSWNQFMKKLMDFTMNAEGGCMVLDKAVKKWVFEGYYDPLAEVAMLLESELIPWYVREHSTYTDKFNSFEINVNESLTYGPCLTKGPLDMKCSDLEVRGNGAYISDTGRKEAFSDDDILNIFKDINEFYAPFVIVTERVKTYQILDLLQKLAYYWLDSYRLVFGSVALLLLIGGVFQTAVQTKNQCVVPCH